MISPETPKPASISLPIRHFDIAKNFFEQDGISFDVAIVDEPRMAYELFRSCVRDALFEDVKVVKVFGGPGVSIDKKQDGEQAFEAIGRSNLDVMPIIGEEGRDVVVSVMSNPSLWSIIRKKKHVPKLINEIRFTVPGI